MKRWLVTGNAHAAALPFGLADRGRGRGASRPLVTWIDGWVLAALAIACLARLVRLDAASLWLDEVLTAQWVALPVGELIRTSMADNHPPLYFLLVRGWASVAGDSVWALRVPSAVASMLAVGGIAMLAAMLRGAVAARWAAGLAALCPYLVHHGQEARMYAVISAVAVVQVIALTRVLRGDVRAPGLLFVLCGWVLAATHYYAALFVGVVLVALLLGLWWRPAWDARIERAAGRRRILAMPRGRRWRAALPALVLTGLAPSAALAAAWLMARHTAGRQYGLGLFALPGTVFSMITGYALLPSAEALHARGLAAALPFLPLAVGTGALVLAASVYGWRALSPAARLIVAVPLLGALFIPLAAQSLGDVGINPRYVAAGAPLLLVWLAAAGPARLGWDGRSVTMLGLLGVMALGTALHLAQPGHGREDVAAAGAWLDRHVPVDHEVLISSFEMEIVARHHWPRRLLRAYPEPGVQADAGNAGSLAAALPLDGDRAYVVLGRAWLTDPDGALRAALRSQYASCGEAAVRGIEMFCLQRPGGRAAVATR